jgi:hypothetical protein
LVYKLPPPPKCGDNVARDSARLVIAVNSARDDSSLGDDVLRDAARWVTVVTAADQVNNRTNFLLSQGGKRERRGEGL